MQQFHFWVQQEGGKLARALPVVVTARGKQFSIQIRCMECCSPLDDQGGTKNTTKELLLA